MKTIKIGNRIFNISTVKNISDEDCWGKTEISKNNIIIKNVNKIENDITFIHEILHCVYRSIGIIEHKEKIISGLSESVYQVLKDNKKGIIDFIKNI